MTNYYCMTVNYIQLNHQCVEALGLQPINLTIEASNQGDVKINDKVTHGTQGSKGKHGYYKTTRIQGKTIYFHRIIYLAFNQDKAQQVKDSARIIMKDDQNTVINGYYRNFPEDLILDPAFQMKPEFKLNDTQQIVDHKYGKVTLGIWYPLHYKTKDNLIIKCETYSVKFFDDIDHPYEIMNNSKKTLLKTFRAMVTLADNGVVKCTVTHVLLCSAFPNTPTEATADHINDNPKDNRIVNLVWLSWSDNSKKGQQKSVESKKAKGGANGRKVIMCDKDNNHLMEFKNIAKAAEYVIENNDKITKEVKTVESKIRRALGNSKYTAYSYYWTEPEETTIDDEEWKELPSFYNSKIYNDRIYKVSSCGRIRSTHGGIMQQVKDRNGAKYSTVYLTLKDDASRRFYVHILVWETFNGKVPEGHEVLHNDLAPLNDNGSYRNWLVDLKLGTRKENMKEYYSAKHIINNK